MRNLTQAKKACSYSQTRLPSGLTVLVRPMPGYSTVHAEYATRFGSVYDRFELEGKPVALPAGVAHFLEHKMFESEEGDAFSLYAKTGANANAYTSFDKTCYLFTSSGEKAEASLDILLNMVGKPYFTEATIAKEQGIIGQEIKMYEDSPDWRLLVGLCGCLYHTHPVKNDIAGSVESIAQITPEMLYACTSAFYSPGNMVLAVAGDITEAQVLEACRRAGLTQPAPLPDARAIWPKEPLTVAKSRLEFEMAVAKPCFGIGFKEAPAPLDDPRREILCDLLSEVICGDMTPLYRRLYDEGLVNPEFGCEYLCLPGCCCLLFTGESEAPDRVRELLMAEIDRLRREGVEEELFTLCKHQMYGRFLQDLENVDDACGAMMGSALKGRALADELEALAALTRADLEAALADMLAEERSAMVVVRPAGEGEE